MALRLSMADPRELLRVQAVLIAGFASVVAAGLLVVFYFDHPYQGSAGSLQSGARALETIEALEPGLPVRCAPSGQPT